MTLKHRLIYERRESKCSQREGALVLKSQSTLPPSILSFPMVCALLTLLISLALLAITTRTSWLFKMCQSVTIHQVNVRSNSMSHFLHSFMTLHGKLNQFRIIYGGTGITVSCNIKIDIENTLQLIYK